MGANMSFDFSGLKELEKRIESLNGNVSFDELFPSDFMIHYTNFSSMSELIDAGGFKCESAEDFKAIPDDEFDLHILKTTNFENWEEMKQSAGAEYFKRKLKF